MKRNHSLLEYTNDIQVSELGPSGSSCFEDLRKVYLPRDVFTRPNTIKFENFMSSNNCDTQLLFKTEKYCKVVLKIFSGNFQEHLTGL